MYFSDTNFYQIVDDDWQNVKFKNFNSTTNYKPRNCNNIQNENVSVILKMDLKYNNLHKISKLPSTDTLFHYTDGMYQINNLFPSLSDSYDQLKIDFYREKCTINNTKVDSYERFIEYVEYSISSIVDRKSIISSCTQAIMSIPLLGIHRYFDLEQYMLGEIDSEIDDKTMYIDLELYNNDWCVHVQKPLRIFDIHNTLYCVLIDIDVDKNGLVVSINPFL